MIYLLLIIFSLLTHLPWINNLGILTSGDWSYQSIQTLKEFFSLPQVWTSFALGSVNITTSFYPFQLFYGVLSQLNTSYGLSERLVFMWPIIIFSPLSSYFLIKKITRNTISSVIGSFVFCYNTYFFSIQTGHLTLLVAYSIAPFALLFFIKSLEEKKILYSLVTGILLFVMSFYEFRALYLFVWILFFFYLYYQICLEKISFKQILKNAFLSGIPILILGLLNIYWLLPLSRLGSIETNEIFNRTLFGNEFLNITNAFTLFHPFWTGGRPTEFIVQSIPLWFWIIPFFAFGGLVLAKKNSYVLFFGLVSLLGILLTKQVGLPFPFFYEWMYAHFPGFNAFREASKFFFIISLGYSVLVAAFVSWLLTNWINVPWKKYSTYAAVGLISFLFLWNAKPAITQELGTLFVQRHVPKDYDVVSHFVMSQSSFFRTFWIPTYSRWNVYTNNHPEVSAIDQINGSWNTFISKEREIIDRYGNVEKYRYSEADLMTLLLTKPYAQNLLSNSSIKYVFIPLQDKANDDNFFRFYGKNQDFYKSKLDNIPYLKKLSIGTKNIIVYENKAAKPHLYSTQEKETIYKSLPYTPVTFSMISPTEYRIRLENVSKPVFLNFSERYHPSWKIRVGEFSWRNVLQKNYFFICKCSYNE